MSNAALAAVLAALLAGAASHDGGLVEETGGQVLQGPLGLRQGHHGLAVDLAGCLEAGLGSEVMVGAGPRGGVGAVDTADAGSGAPVDGGDGQARRKW